MAGDTFLTVPCRRCPSCRGESSCATPSSPASMAACAIPSIPGKRTATARPGGGNVPGDDDKLADWPGAEACPAAPDRDRLRLALPARCRQERTEPPGPSRIERIAGTAEGLCQRRFTVRTAAIPAPGAVVRFEELITASDLDDDAGGGFLRELKGDPWAPVTRVFRAVFDGHLGRSTALAAGKRRPGRPAIQRQAPAYHVRWLVVSKLARRRPFRDAAVLRGWPGRLRDASLRRRACASRDRTRARVTAPS